ncbi:MAG: hypothetical protein MUF45_18210 [Spirosomaceae bacterium]|nr:hypothetical protein [Spirosomataceae bacterium]
MIQYLNFKTRSANRGSKSRSSFANLYAIYVIIEDYLDNNFDSINTYSTYEGASYTKIFQRQRTLPFGSKLQNHALNNRMNAEFEKFFPNSVFKPILRNLETNRYWINENLLKLRIGETEINIAPVIINIIDEYIKSKQNAFDRFVKDCEELQTLSKTEPSRVLSFINNLLAPTSDARLFEIVSYAILKNYYSSQKIFWGFELDKINEDSLKLFKTGRTNANDGGIDFVMQPLGRFFQVTETLDFRKYFLDIDKIQKYPMTFVVKSIEPTEIIKEKIFVNAQKTYSIQSIITRYMDCIEEIVNIPKLKYILESVSENNGLNNILDEILLQSKIEFNYTEEDEEE